MFRVFLFLLLPFSLIAQDSTDSIGFSINLDEYIVTAQYEPTHYKKSIHNITLIQKRTIKKIGAVTLDQALKLSPNIRLKEDPILGTSIKMRGVEARNVAILIDGIPVIGRNNGAIDLSQISLQNVERIEIVEGPLSCIYGNNAAGGVINIITKKSQIRKWSTDISNQIETIGKRNHVANIGFQEGKFNLFLYGRYFKYDQFLSDSLRISDKVELSNGDIILESRYPFNPKTQKSYGSFLRYNFNGDNYLLAKYDFNIEDVTDFGIIKRPQYEPYGEDQFYSTIRKDFSLNYNGKFKEHLFLNMQMAFNRFDRIRDDKRYYINTMMFDPDLQYSDSIRFHQAFGKASINYTGATDWVFGGGFNYTKESGEGDRLLNPEQQDSLTASFSEFAFYSDIRYNGFSNVQLSISNRYTKHSTYDDALTTAIQAKLELNKKTTIRSSFAQGYRSPSLKELYLDFIDINHNIIGNPNLKPERSFDIQSTISYQAFKQLQISFNGYYTRIQDRITLLEYETLKFRYGNNDQYRVLGFQPSIQYNQDNLTINSNFSLGFWSTNIEFQDVPNFGTALDWNTTYSYIIPKSKITALINHRYVGSQPTYRLQNEMVEIGYIDDYHLIDLSASKSFLKNKINLIIGVRNLFDTKSVQLSNNLGGMHSGGAKNNISPGRSTFLTLQYALQ